MTGWIKANKELTTTIRFRRMLKAYRHALRGVTDRDVTSDTSLLLGALFQLWMYADSHISDDNILAITLDEIDEVVGVHGFAECVPAEWLKVIDAEHVELPDFLEHNGTSARQRKNAAKRQANHRWKKKQLDVTRDVTHSNARNDARPDQTRLEKTREKNPTASATPPVWFSEFRLAYPKRAADQGWSKAERAAHARLAEGHSPQEFIEGAKRYAAYCVADDIVGTKYVKQAATFLGPDKPFLLAWNPPPSKGQRAQDTNVSNTVEWLRRDHVAS